MNTLAAAGLLTRAQIAAEFDVHEKTIWLWERDLGFPVHKVGRSSFYDIEEVTRWVRRRNKKAA